MTDPLIRRFRAEIRERDDISPNTTVILDASKQRSANTLLAKLLLEEVFHGRIDVKIEDGGLLCGSREEAAAGRLTEYTTDNTQNQDVLLSSLTRQEIETLLKQRGHNLDVFVPDTPEVRMLDRLANQYDDVRYGA